jgi:hypothetical protein
VGDRSHPRLRALNILMGSGLTYSGWQSDVRKAVKAWPIPSGFDDWLRKMQKKQDMYMTQHYAHGLNAREPQLPRSPHESDENYLTISQKIRCTNNRNDTWNQPAGVQDGDKECVICMGSKKAYVFVPCGHLCLCYECAASMIQMGSRRCPLCRRISEKIIKVYQ